MRPYRPKKIFTVEQANATLPLVKAITADIVELSRDVRERRQRLGELSNSPQPREGDPYAEEVAHVEEELARDTQRLQDFVAELREIGVEPKSGPDGLIDFPCEMDGRIVYLCWKLGEPEILYWHELDAGFAGRQPLTAGSLSDDSLESEQDSIQ